MKTITFAIANLAFLCSAVLFFQITPGALAAVNPAGPYEVIVYEAADYIGKSKSWRLEPNAMRIRTINYVGDDMKRKISSVHVGSKVNAILFFFRDFQAVLKRDTPSFNKGVIGFGHPDDPHWKSFYIQGMDTYKKSTPLVLRNDAYSALVILPKDFKGAWGAGLYYYRDNKLGHLLVVPIPELKTEKVRPMDNVGSLYNDNVWRVKLLGTSNKNIKVTLYEHANFGGRSLPIPGPGSGLQDFHLNTYNFAGILTSLRVEYTGADTSPSPPTGPYEVVPIKPQTKMAPADPGLAGKLPQPNIPSGKLMQVEFADIAGQWMNRRGIAYDIDQKGNTFHWFAPELQEEAHGTINGNNLSVSWKAPKGSGATTGKVSKTSPEGIALTITWDNGALLKRKAP